MFDYADRRRRLSEVMRAEGVDLLFLGLSSDLEYLSGVERGIPFFGQSSYPHGWVAGGFFRPDADPVFVLPRMVVVFDLPVRPEGEVVVVDEMDDGRAVFERVARGLGARGRVAVGDRVWAETTLELGRIFGLERLRTGSSLVNRLRRVKTPDELAAMGRACRTVEQAMAAVGPRVQPGVTMAESEVHRRVKLLREAGVGPDTLRAVETAWRSIFSIVAEGPVDTAVARLRDALTRLEDADDLARYVVPAHVAQNPMISPVPPAMPVDELVEMLSAERDPQLAHDPALDYARITCPIGVPGMAGKQPEVIAVAVAAQLLQLAPPEATTTAASLQAAGAR